MLNCNVTIGARSGGDLFWGQMLKEMQQDYLGFKTCAASRGFLMWEIKILELFQEEINIMGLGKYCSYLAKSRKG